MALCRRVFIVVAVVAAVVLCTPTLVGATERTSDTASIGNFQLLDLSGFVLLLAALPLVLVVLKAILWLSDKFEYREDRPTPRD